MDSALSRDENCGFIVNDCFDSVAFLNHIKDIDVACMTEDYFNRLDRLCKKIDVVKSVKKYYTADLSKSRSDEVLNGHELLLFVFILTRFSALYKDPKFLNSAFKLIDQIVSELPDSSQQEVVGLRAKAVKVLDAL